MVRERKPLGKILEEMKVVSVQQVKDALNIQKQNPGKKLGEILVEKKWATPEQVTQALAKQFDIPYFDVRNVDIPIEVIEAVPQSVVDEYKVLPIRINGRIITVAMSDPLDFYTLDNLRFILNRDIESVLAEKNALQEAIVKFYGTKEKTALDDVLEELTSSDITFRGVTTEDEDVVDDAPVIKLVALLISEAVKMRASDIHVEPMEKKLRIRYRIDGVCKEMDAPPKKLQGSILSRIKIMADMDISEKRKPQDGRIKINMLGKELDLRVSALPATHGESIVMRILDKHEGLVGLEELGFHPDDYRRFKTIIKRPNGIMLVTGPTGSGKTTTLYAALKELNTPDVKIITAENPIEYNISGINQAQVKEGIGFTFARIIRAMLRQAPNIILVGEIRDTETAEIAIQAALTGHLVFSTLHTNDASSAITRLVDMGVKPFLVASSLQAIMAQRLIRILCNNCKEPYTPDPSDLAAVGLKSSDVEGKQVFRAKDGGCEECKGAGYKSRKGIFELMELNSTIREMAFRKEPTVKIAEQARLSGMVTLMEDGVRKFLSGLTSIDEILLITHREDITY